MSSNEATVLEIRKRIESIEDEKYRLAFMYQFLIGGEISEVCGQYSPMGDDARFVNFEIDREIIPAIIFFIKTARKQGKLRTCTVPLDPHYEPWARQLGDWFTKNKGRHPFIFSATMQSSKRYLQLEAERVFDGLLWLMSEYQLSRERRDVESDGKIAPRYKPFRGGMLRQLRRRNLLDFYHFNEKDLALYGEWRELIKNPQLKTEVYKVLDSEKIDSDTDVAIRRGEEYITKLLRPLDQLGLERLPVYLTSRSFHDLSSRFKRAQEISVRVGHCNTLGSAKVGAEFFKESMNIVLEMFNPCRNKEQFTSKIASLSALFTIELDPLRALVASPEGKRSIRLIETWLSENRTPYKSDMIETWLNIVRLRNMEPIHETDPTELKRILDFYGLPLTFPLGYSELWDEVLDKFLWSVEEFRTLLNSL